MAQSKPKKTAAKKSADKKSIKRKRVVLNFKSEPGNDVFVAGSFNDWQIDQKQLKDNDGTGDFAITLMLPVGEHEYKFITNGRWQADPNAETWTPNPFGSLNSVIRVNP